MPIRPQSFLNRSLQNTQDRIVLHETPAMYMQTMIDMLGNGGAPEIETLDTPRRVMTQVFIRICQDFGVITGLFQQGYEIQGYTLLASMIESTFLISYIECHPEKAQAWLESEREASRETFSRWLNTTLDDMQNKGELSADEREAQHAGYRADYRVACAYKHSSGVALRQSNTFQMPGEKLSASVEPPYNKVSRAACMGGMVDTVATAKKAIFFYGYAMRLTAPLAVVKQLERGLELALTIQTDVLTLSLEPRALTPPAEENPAS